MNLMQILWKKNAKIVAKLACKLRLADIPGAAHCISSLLDPHLMKKAAQTGRNYDFHIIDIDERVEIKPPFLHGLVILGELATDPDNCREIYNTMDLIPKIIAPVSNGLHIAINDDETIEIVRESLSVLARLTSGTSESSRKLCHELTTKYGRTVENMLWVLRNSSDQEMAERATEILSRLTLSKETMSDFVVVLQRLLMEPQDSSLRTEAGKALSALIRSHGDEFWDKFPDIQQLVTIMSADEYSEEYKAVTAEMLAQLCARSRADQDRFNRLSTVANALLSTVLKDITEPGFSTRKFLASLLGLAVQIREKLVTPEAFADAVTGLPKGNNIFAETLKQIIEMANDSEDEICLSIMKSAIKLVTWMTEIEAISPGYYTDYFRQVIIAQELDATVWAMAHLERYVVMTGGADEKEGYVTLQTIVETAKNKLL